VEVRQLDSSNAIISQLQCPGPELGLPPSEIVVNTLPWLVVVGVVALLLAVMALTEVDMLPLVMAAVVLAVVAGVAGGVPGRH
jgi:hypothetical protein